jgi:hypothetical protein
MMIEVLRIKTESFGAKWCESGRLCLVKTDPQGQKARNA